MRRGVEGGAREEDGVRYAGGSRDELGAWDGDATPAGDGASRRAVLRVVVAAGVTGLGGLPGATGRGAAHPGPYRPFARLPLRGATEAVVGDDGSTVFVAATSGFAVVDVSTPSDPRVLADRRRILADRETGPLQGIQDVKADGDRLAVVGPANPTGGEVLQGMAVHDVADPSEPAFVGFFETDYPIHNCFVRDGVAYLTGNDGDRNPLVMVDVSGDEPAEVGRWSVLDDEPGWADVPRAVWAIHDVWAQDGLAYVSHWDAGTWIVDVRDPADATTVSHVGAYDPPELAGLEGREARNESLQLPGNAHYAMVDERDDLLAVGREAWDQDGTDDREGGPGGIDLFDVSDPASPEHLSTIEAPPSPEPSIGGVWTTSHNFDLRDGWLYTAWYRGGVKIFDVLDPSDPTEIAAWRDPEHTSFWTAKRARGCYVAPSRHDPSVGTPDTAELFTFPDHPGFQADRPTMPPNGSAPDSGGNSSGGDPSGTDGTTSGGGTAPTDDGTAGDGATATTSGGQAGLGLGAGLVGAGLGAWWRSARE